MQISVATTIIKGLRVTEVIVNKGAGLILGADLFEKTGLPPYARVQIQNMQTGTHWDTFVVPSTNLGNVTLCGPDSRLGEPTDDIVIVLYAKTDFDKQINPPKEIIFE